MKQINATYSELILLKTFTIELNCHVMNEPLAID